MSTTDSSAPRRSSRLSAQPKEEVKTTAKTRKPSVKRTAEAAAEKTTAKKAKSSPEHEENTEDNDTLPKIDLGDILPSILLKNEEDVEVDVADLVSEKGLVLFLVPKADTPGCTNQACGFRDIYPDFTSHNYEVYCLSADSPTAQSKWKTKKELPYPLLSDPKRKLITALGAGEGGKTKRSHFIFEKGGKLVDKKIPVKPAESPALALEFINSL
ncbi:thioredoxin-dependent peroxiredoxin [Pleurotus pulmonarius]|nr:hypothetical protein EYR36_011882 [Pleurotus pulmonarius]KAF4607236.1 hypothetical protein EYR38_001297 [Pleurotus pulmonarius]